MASQAKKAVQKGRRGTGGPPGTAAQRASRKGGSATKVPKSGFADRMTKKGTQLPNSQGH